MIKPTFDIIFAVFFSILLIPFWLVILLIPSVSIFTQDRVGKDGNLFTIYKLKTMKDGKITKLGYFLRKTKIDELPQLYNILIGDMVFVGPRPDIQGYYDKLVGDNRNVLQLKPGITSLAALKYINEEQLLANSTDPKKYNDRVIFPDKVQMNLDYLNKKSIWYDLYIIGLTLKAIFVKINFTM